MVISYTNRKKEIYYLHEGKSKTGKPKYYFSKKSDKNIINFIPKGFEIYENPNAQVFLRKIIPSAITEEDISIIKNSINKYSDIKLFIVDVKGNVITVYINEDPVSDICNELSKLFPFAKLNKSVEIFERSLQYTKMLRFILEDENSREFIVQRYCFGSIDDWIFLDASNDLKSLSKNYCQHLGKESFYDQM